MIRTEYIKSPIPTTQYDWLAYIDGEEGPTGRGATEFAAVRDLCEQLAEKYVEIKEKFTETKPW